MTDSGTDLLGLNLIMSDTKITLNSFEYDKNMSTKSNHFKYKLLYRFIHKRFIFYLQHFLLGRTLSVDLPAVPIYIHILHLIQLELEQLHCKDILDIFDFPLLAGRMPSNSMIHKVQRSVSQDRIYVLQQVHTYLNYQGRRC